MYGEIMVFYAIFQSKSVVKTMTEANIASWWNNMETVLPVETLFPASKSSIDPSKLQ